jgi:hypothetical protein
MCFLSFIEVWQIKLHILIVYNGMYWWIVKLNICVSVCKNTCDSTYGIILYIQPTVHYISSTSSDNWKFVSFDQ